MVDLQGFSQVFVISLMFLMFILISKENTDFVATSLLIAIIAIIITSLIFPINIEDVITFLPFSTIIYLLAIDVIIMILKKEKIFQYLTVQIIRLTKGNVRLFFYVICLASALASGLMEDISVSVIFIPLVLRATKILKIDAKPFICGLNFSISLGNLLTPFACAYNILISEYFDLNVGWFIKNLFFIFFILQLITLLLIDFLMLKKQNPPNEHQKIILLSIMHPNLLIIDKKKFIRHIFYMLIIFSALIFIPFPHYVALLGAILLCLIEKRNFSSFFEKMDWKMPFFFIALFLFIACMTINNTIEIISKFVMNLMENNLIIGSLIILFFGSLIASFTSKSLATIMFLSIFEALFINQFSEPMHQTILLIALILAVNLGGNILPQSSSHILKSLEYAKKYKIEKLNYKLLARQTSLFSFTSIFIGFIFLIFRILIF